MKKPLPTFLVLAVISTIGVAVFISSRHNHREELNERWDALYERLEKSPSSRNPETQALNTDSPEGASPVAVTLASDLAIQRSGIFGSILFPIDSEESGTKDRETQNKALLALANTLSGLDHKTRLAALRRWITENPDSRWRPAIQDLYLEERFNRGYFSEAREGWNGLWEEVKDNITKDALLFGNRVMGRLLDTHRGIARNDRLRELVADMEGRYRDGVLEGKLLRARQSIWLREHTGAQNVMCGPLALNAIATHLGKNYVAPNLNQVKTDQIFTGIPLTDIQGYAEDRYELPAQLATRVASSVAVPTPSVVHFNDEHYAAVLAHDSESDRYLLEDRMLEFKDWVDADALTESMSGNILLATNTALPEGWAPLEESVARNVFGRDGAHGIEDPEENVTEDDTTTDDDPEGPDFPDPDDPDDAYDPNEADPDDPGNCEGMPRYTFHPFPGSLRISDIPLRYNPPVGPRVAFKINYVDLSGDASDSDVAPIGPGWCTNWVSYILPAGINPYTGTPNNDATVILPGGGRRVYRVNYDTGSFDRSDRDFSELEVTTEGVQGSIEASKYTLRHANGWTHVYSHYVQRQTAPTFRFFLTEVIDPAGNTLRLVYKDEDPVFPNQGEGSTRLHSIVDAKERVTLVDYGPDDTALSERIIGVRDPFGRSCSLEYDGMGRLSAVTDIIGLRSTFTYTTEGFPATMTTPYGQTTFTKSGEGFAGVGDPLANGTSERIIEATDPMGRTERVQFIDKTGGPEIPSLVAPAQTVDVGGSQVPFYAENSRLNFRNSFYWDKEQYHAGPGDPSFAVNYRFYTDENYQVTGVLEAIKQPLQSRTWFNYPGAGIINSGGHSYYPGDGRFPEKRMRMLDASTAQLTQTYRNDLGKVTRVVDPVGRSTVINYAANGIDVTAVTQTSGGINERLATATYNDQHLPLTVTDAAGYTTTLTYNSIGQLTSLVNAKNETTTFGYDSFLNLVTIDGALPGVQDQYRFEYDSQDRINRVIAPDGYSLSFARDDFDRVTQISFPNGTTRLLEYDRLDLAAVTDRIGLTTRYTYHPDRRIQSVTDPADRVLQYVWCRCGDLRELTDPMGRTTRWIRDAQGRVTRKQYVDGSGTDYEYDGISGRLVRRTDAKGQHKLHEYTIDGRLAQVSYPNAEVETPTVAWTYDSKYPRLATMTDGEGLTNYAYHPVTGGTSAGAGQLESIDGPWENDVIEYKYDELGRTVRRAIGGMVEGVAFDAGGRIITITNELGNFIHEYEGGTHRLARLECPNGQLTNYLYAGSSGDRRLTHITNIKPDGSTLSAFQTEYDSAGRVTKWHQHQFPTEPNIYSLVYDNSGQLTSAKISRGGLIIRTFTWEYDPAGNRSLEIENGRVYRFQSNELNEVISTDKPIPEVRLFWDAENRLRRLQTSENTIAISYGGDGIMKKVFYTTSENTSEHWIISSGRGFSEERSSNGLSVNKRSYHYGESRRTHESTFTPRFFSKDHLGSIREITDENGEIVNQCKYDLWGQQSTISGTLPNLQETFTGHRLLTNTLIAAPYRTYSPQIGRWTGRDPIGEPGGFNVYQYVLNSPAMHIDPNGLDNTPPPHPIEWYNRDSQLTQNYIQGYKDRTQAVFDLPRGLARLKFIPLIMGDAAILTVIKMGPDRAIRVIENAAAGIGYIEGYINGYSDRKKNGIDPHHVTEDGYVYCPYDF